MKIVNCLFSIAMILPGSMSAQTVKSFPNVIYIMADDLGIGDLGCYGQRQIKRIWNSIRYLPGME